MAVSLIALLLLSAFTEVGSFNIDTSQPTVFQGNNASFGQSIVQFRAGSSTWVVVSSPLEPDVSGQVGKLYKCSYEEKRCSAINIPVLPESKMSSFGLTLAASSQRLVGCGIVPKECRSFTYIRGLCYSMDQNFKSTRLTKEPDCPKGADIVFLIDGSGSVVEKDFTKMKRFVQDVMGGFKGHDVLFALMQYSHRFTLHFDFNQFRERSDIATLMKSIKQQGGGTHTPTAILKVVREVFVPEKGSRLKANKILIIITDGKTQGDTTSLSDVINEAEANFILRYAIGVGNAFTSRTARQELDTIASSPKDQHTFSPNNFDALGKIQETLQQKIFSIEGTQAANFSSFQFEMAQTGSSAAFSQTSTLLGAVGAYDWSGGLFVYPQQGPSEPTYIKAPPTRDSYLGYSTKVANLRDGPLYVSGAPRYRHIGRVMVFGPNGNIIQAINGSQVGSYFGAELCTLDMKGDGITDLLLIAAPVYQSQQASGIVLVYKFSRSTVSPEPQKILQGVTGNSFGRFGSAIAALGDINGDGRADLAIGAPLENERVGTVYIFHGEDAGIKSQYSQRIIGSQVSSGVRFFGRSISGGMDVSKDNLKDVAVGAEGMAFILRSWPVLRVTPSITFQPPEIPLARFECAGAASVGGVVSSARVCFEVTKVTSDSLGSLQATVDFGLRLDAALRVNPRAVFESGKRDESGTVDVTSGFKRCYPYRVKLPACVDDSLSAIVLMVNFTVLGKEVSQAGALRPVVDRDAPTYLTAELPFERNCGQDNQCDDKLKVSFNYSGLSVMAVGVTPSIDLTVSIQNDGEDSYKTLVNFFFPAGLSYRKVTLLDSSRRTLIRCDGGVESTEDPARSSSCRINHPIFKKGSRAIFAATFDVSEDFSWGQNLVVKTNATSDNGDQQNPESLYTAELPVQYGVNVVLRSMEEESVRYINFTRKPQKEEKKLVRHVYQVRNWGRRSLDLQVTFLIPISLGPSLVWDAHGVTPSTGRAASCKEIALTPGSADMADRLSELTKLDCAMLACRKVQCEVSLLQKDVELRFIIEGDVGNGWIPQGSAKKLSLISAAEITFDRSKYVDISHESDSFLQAQMETTIEVNEKFNYLPLILGSSLGGLVLLALISAGLYKAGFFSRRYKRMMEDTSHGTSSETSSPAGKGGS
ncbi:integrin alpha-D-like isoform X2 [Ambystoma mexicanum]|uniref:integrin alpha-D-like isoform X2 n=1 Tax=Ambystoma mexicanum TaxID=8296 RepID=UPI0037E99264